MLLLQSVLFTLHLYIKCHSNLKLPSATMEMSCLSYLTVNLPTSAPEFSSHY